MITSEPHDNTNKYFLEFFHSASSSHQIMRWSMGCAPTSPMWNRACLGKKARLCDGTMRPATTGKKRRMTIRCGTGNLHWLGNRCASRKGAVLGMKFGIFRRKQ